MRRFLAIVAFLAGGIATEMAHPVQCELINASRMLVKRRKE
ncbi:hypothetical protein [Burkholderia sp. Leaf177]|nr:hypothetical protein [Burkholderia sp. Leaf177]